MSNAENQRRLLLAMLQAEHELIRACNRVYKRFGVTYHQFQILRILDAAGKPLSQGTIGEHLLVSKANLSGLLDRMAAAGLVRRKTSPKDRRVRLIGLTERGREVMKAVEPMRDTVESILLSDMDPDEAQQVAQILENIAARARDIG